MLKPTLMANAASCAFFGLLFTFLSIETSIFLGSPPVLLIMIFGIGLLLNTAMLLFAATRTNIPRWLIINFVAGDVAWVLFTAILLTFGIWITTTAGILTSIGVAIFVGLCGWFQWKFAPGH